MKKLVLIPQERYEQLVLREVPNQCGGASEQEVKDIKEETKEDDTDTKEPADATEVPAGQENRKEDKVTDNSAPIPPPGEPDRPKQTGGGGETVKNRKQKENPWKSRWSAY